MTKHAAIYARIIWEPGSVSLAQQLRTCRQYVEQRGYVLVGEFTDGVQGFRDHAGRVALCSMIAGALVDVVVCYSIDLLCSDGETRQMLSQSAGRRRLDLESVHGPAPAA